MDDMGLPDLVKLLFFIDDRADFDLVPFHRLGGALLSVPTGAGHLPCDHRNLVLDGLGVVILVLRVARLLALLIDIARVVLSGSNAFGQCLAVRSTLHGVVLGRSAYLMGSTQGIDTGFVFALSHIGW